MHSALRGQQLLSSPYQSRAYWSIIRQERAELGHKTSFDTSLIPPQPLSFGEIPLSILILNPRTTKRNRGQDILSEGHGKTGRDVSRLLPQGRHLPLCGPCYTWHGEKITHQPTCDREISLKKCIELPFLFKFYFMSYLMLFFCCCYHF